MIRQSGVNTASFMVSEDANVQWVRVITKRERNCNDLQCADTDEEL